MKSKVQSPKSKVWPRFQRCRGLRIPLGKRRQLEIWFCPGGEKIPLHFHRKMDSFLFCLWGRMRWTLARAGCLLIRPVCGPVRRSRDGWKLACFKVPHHVGHGAEVLGRFAIFANFETLNSQLSTLNYSASHDFQCL